MNKAQVKRRGLGMPSDCKHQSACYEYGRYADHVTWRDWGGGGLRNACGWAKIMSKLPHALLVHSYDVGVQRLEHGEALGPDDTECGHATKVQAPIRTA